MGLFKARSRRDHRRMPPTFEFRAVAEAVKPTRDNCSRGANASEPSHGWLLHWFVRQRMLPAATVVVLRRSELPLDLVGLSNGLQKVAAALSHPKPSIGWLLRLLATEALSCDRSRLTLLLSCRAGSHGSLAVFQFTRDRRGRSQLSIAIIAARSRSWPPTLGKSQRRRHPIPGIRSSHSRSGEIRSLNSKCTK